MKTAKLLLALVLVPLMAACASVTGNNKKILDHDPLIQAIDTNKDGCMNLKEWQAKGMPMSAFNMLAKNGCVTKRIMLDTGAPDGIDINGDGVLTLEEFLEFDKTMAPPPVATGGSEAPESRPVISAAERALAMWEVQNVMSKHAYLHAAGFHQLEMETCWVDAQGPNARTATFANPMMIMNGYDVIYRLYVTEHIQNQKKSLKAISAIHPEIKNIPENMGTGHEWVMHTNTTPLIEIAGDGKSAKGIWYSPGIGLGPKVKKGNVEVRGTFFWEKYAADFLKENGQWKLWHIQMFYDFTPALDSKWTDARGGGPPLDEDKDGKLVQAAERVRELPEGCTPNPKSYQNWSPTRLPDLGPKFPEPYYTFSETFSY